MYSEKKIDEYIEAVKNGDYKEDFKRLQKLALENGVTYDNKVIPFTYQPLLVSKRDRDAFKFIVTRTNEIIRKVTEEYLKNEDFRKLFNFSKELEELILHDPLYEVPVAIGRYDVFFNSLTDFQFCEINTDGSSAMSEDSGLAEVFKISQIFKDLGWIFESFELYDSWVLKALEVYDYVRGGHEKITVAIADYSGSGTPTDFKIFKEAFIRAGVNCIIADVEKFKYDSDKNLLTYDGETVDLVYRRAVTSEIMEKYDESIDFIKAYLNNAFVCIGSFRSQIAHNKIFFEVLHRDEVRAFLDEDDLMFIDDHVPFTAKFGGDEAFFEEIVKNKDEYIFKPNDLRGARGVFVGRELNEEEFINKALEVFNNDFIYQKFVDKKLIKFIELDENDEWKIVERGNMIGLFSYLESFKGIYARFGVDNIIGSIREYIVAPAFKYE